MVADPLGAAFLGKPFIVFGVVRQSGGDVSVESQLGVGSKFKILLPRTADADSGLQGESVDEKALRGTETILFVEDEHDIRHLAVRTLQRLGYTVHEAGNGREALSLAERLTTPPQLLITDVIMPQMSGIKLVSLLTESHPDLKVLFITGYTDTALDEMPHLLTRYAFLAKPFKPSELAAKVWEVLNL